MKRSILLNWLPFENTATGAAKRSIELNERLAGDFHIRGAVTSGFPCWAAPSINRIVAAEARNLSTRLSERRPEFWTGLGEFQVFVTDTLPVPVFNSGKKVILTVHDLRFLHDRSYLPLQRYLLLKLFMAGSLKRADAVVTVSKWIAGQLIHHYNLPLEKVSVIPNAAASLPAASGQSSFGEGFLLSVGHLETRKDQRTLIRAFALIADSWEGKLVIAGQGPLEKELKALAEGLGISSRIVFAGSVTDGELASLYRHCRILVCPSLYEGFGMTVLEGLEAEAPVIASSIPSHLEVAGDSAHWFTPGSVENLSTVLSEVLNGKAGTTVSSNLQRASEFSWDASAELLGNIYRKI